MHYSLFAPGRLISMCYYEMLHEYTLSHATPFFGDGQFQARRPKRAYSFFFRYMLIGSDYHTSRDDESRNGIYIFGLPDALFWCRFRYSRPPASPSAIYGDDAWWRYVRVSGDIALIFRIRTSFETICTDIYRIYSAMGILRIKDGGDDFKESEKDGFWWLPHIRAECRRRRTGHYICFCDFSPPHAYAKYNEKRCKHSPNTARHDMGLRRRNARFRYIIRKTKRAFSPLVKFRLLYAFIWLFLYDDAARISCYQFSPACASRWHRHQLSLARLRKCSLPFE